jgi:signal transduction histidine kinase
LIERNETLVRDQAEREEQAAADERRRIARELHDIVAHRVTTMVIQAESGAATAEDAEQAGRAFRAIAGSGREALDELRRLLGLLRDGGEPSTRPVPGVARIGELIDEVRQTGVTVEARIGPGTEPLPAGLDLAVYRVVQEALTNALRHGGGRVSLEITSAADEVLVDVRNPLRPVAAIEGHGAGRGLAGMRERIRVYGGTLTTHPVDGEWVLQARLPVAGADR